MPKRDEFRYADRTPVAATHTRAEIEDLFRKFGVDSYVSGFQKGGSIFQAMFTINDRNVVMRVNLTGDEREQQRLMRCLLLNIKAKLVAAHEGLFSAEDEFLAQTVTRSGVTVGEYINEIARGRSASSPLQLMPPPKEDT